MNLKTALLGIVLVWATSSLNAQQAGSKVTIVGQMKNVMWKGQLEGNIFLDTIADKTRLYGLGPVEYLSGEIVVIDGKSYRSTVVSDSTMKVEETYDLKASFFGYAHISEWKEQSLPGRVRTVHQLEDYLNQITKSSPRPFLN